MRRLATFLFLAASALLPVRAQYDFGQLGGDGGKEGSSATLVSEVKSIAPGKPFTVALQLKHPEEWHSYYVNSGGVEKAPELKWTLPDGFTAGLIQWPTPEVKDGFFGKSFVFGGSPVFLVDITPPSTLKAGDHAKLELAAGWQICKEMCKDEKATLNLDLTVADAPVTDASKAEFFQKVRKTHPRASTAWSYISVNKGDTFEVRLTPGAGAAGDLDKAGLEFVPAVPFVQALSDGGSLKHEGSSWVLVLKRKTKDALENDIPVGRTISGILSAKTPLDTTTGSPAIVLTDVGMITKVGSMVVEYSSVVVMENGQPGATDSSGKSVATSQDLPFPKLLFVLGSMAVGGLILNLMPCVFPVIGLKIMGFVQQAGEDRRKVVVHGLAFTAGVLISFWVLSGVLFAARAAAFAKTGSAESVGWGYQLQDPRVVLGLLLLMFVLALNMFGVFEIGASATSIGGSLQAKQGTMGAFFSGVLATLVATPCSAPFLGVAIGTAIGLPAVQFFLCFTAMGIGLAFPYLLLSCVPSLIRFLPRPGAWMESFKQAMSFLLFATAGYLLWVYVGQISLENMLGPVFGLSSIALGAWIYGRWHLPHRTARTRMTAVVLALVFVLGGVWLSKPPAKSALVWEHWSDARVQELLKQGTPVYVDFTAQWCATCQVNKKRAYTPEVIKLMNSRGVVTLKADKTNPDPAIETKLRELNRSAIPVNVLYVPGKEPVITPELLSPGYLTDLIGKEVPAK
ncbi:thioredoxin family protein [Luteolibacter ambystomatis]|uniref:Thioredoxin family protein n=1 Tax=Luteolibacter ambystomatis TaxID=2824561 RepID=A0A975G8F5_9BACT|nr:protein-disulfide reductase DsbD [Luteolibacter ambystomatis]QUE51252.1 thioredoxin family protein [Luteolibacter ambystomatis]